MLLDTSGLLALLLKGEPKHNAATELYRAADKRVTHNYVLAEFIALALVRGLDRRLALDFAATL